MPTEPRQYDPTKAHPGRVLLGWRFVPELGDFCKEFDYEEPQDVPFLNTADNPDTSTWDVIQEEVVNERNGNKVRHKQTAYPRRDADEENYPAVVEEVRSAEELQEFIDQTVITSRLERKGGNLNAEELGANAIFRAELTQFGPYHNVRKRYQAWDNIFLVLTSFETDPTTGHRVRVTRSVVTSVPSPLTVPKPAGVTVSYKEVANGVWIKEFRELLQVDGETPITGATAFSTVTYNTRINFTFPAFIRPFNPGTDIIRTLNKNQRRTIFDVRIRTRREFTANVWARKVVTYHATAPAKPTVFEWRYVDWKHDGAVFRVNIERVIANETPIIAITLNNDTFYGAYNETVFFPASPGLNTDQYLAAVGNEQLVDVEVNQIENRTFRMVKTYVFME